MLKRFLRWLLDGLMFFFWFIMIIVGLLLCVTFIGALIGIPLIVFAYNKISYYIIIDKYGRDVSLQKIYIEDEDSKGTYTRETEMFLLKTKKGEEVFNENERGKKDKFSFIKEYFIKNDKLGYINMTNKEFKQFINQKGGGNI